VTPAQIAALLTTLRQQPLLQSADQLGSHQLDAQLSLAYACGQPPEPWELYRSATLHLMPTTAFFVSNADAIQNALRPNATWELLREHAGPKLALQAAMTEQECKAHGYPGPIQFILGQRWTTAHVPRIPWFDSRDLYRTTLSEGKMELEARVSARLERMRAAVIRNPTPRRKQELEGYELYASGRFQERLSQLDSEHADTRRWLAKLDQTPDFGKTVFALLRAAENAVRAAHGLAAVGEGWISETELLYRVRQLLPDVDVIAHGQPQWLGRQHLDIWIPAMGVAIEYHGIQHFQSVDFFGGEAAFRRGQERDRRKRMLCAQNGMHLVEIAYDQSVDNATLTNMLVGR